MEKGWLFEGKEEKNDEIVKPERKFTAKSHILVRVRISLTEIDSVGMTKRKRKETPVSFLIKQTKMFNLV